MKSIIRVCIFAAALFTALPFLTWAQEAAPEEAAVTATPAPQPPKPVEPPVVRVVDAANSNEAVVSMSFDETPLADVIKAFRDATGANIISGGTNLQGTVSVRLDKVPWRKGLSSILEPQNLQLVEQPAGSSIFVVTTKTVEIPKITRTFELNHAKADDVAKLFKSTLGNTGLATPFPSANVVIVTAPEQQLGECEKILSSIDKASPQVYIEARFVELSSDASKKLGMRWNSLGAAEGWGVSFDGASMGYTADSGRSKTRGQSSSSGNSFNDTSTRINSSKDTTSSDRSSSFENDLADITGQDSSGNGTENSLTRTLTDIVSGSASRTFDSTRSHSRDRTFSGSLSMDAFALTMNAFEQINGASIFKNPKIIVANEQIAKIDMTTKEPNVEVDFQAATQQGQRDSVSTKLGLIPGKNEPFVGEAFFSYGITLSVTPRINPTGLITVDIEPSLSELDANQPYYRPSGLDENMPVARYPIIKMQRIRTTFTMQSGTTAVIGGLSKTVEGNTDSGIPMLRKLPWIGPRLFGWKSRDREQREIIIFVTVGVADPNALPENIGVPKNAILSRELMNGATKEPGDRTKEEVMSLEDPKPPKKVNTQPEKQTTETPAASPAPASTPAPAPAPAPEAPSVSERDASNTTQPADVAPLLQDK